jgi:hypothetical protein
MAKINPATYSDTRALIWLPHALLQRVGNWTCWTIIWNWVNWMTLPVYTITQYTLPTMKLL